jgi:hypothetical protein
VDEHVPEGDDPWHVRWSVEITVARTWNSYGVEVVPGQDSLPVLAAEWLKTQQDGWTEEAPRIGSRSLPS